MPVHQKMNPALKSTQKRTLAIALIAGGTFIVGWIAFLALLSVLFPWFLG